MVQNGSSISSNKPGTTTASRLFDGSLDFAEEFLAHLVAWRVVEPVQEPAAGGGFSQTLIGWKHERAKYSSTSPTVNSRSPCQPQKPRAQAASIGQSCTHMRGGGVVVEPWVKRRS